MNVSDDIMVFRYCVLNFHEISITTGISVRNAELAHRLIQKFVPEDVRTAIVPLIRLRNPLYVFADELGNIYSVSTAGCVKYHRPSLSGDYPAVLGNTIHRMVAWAFLGPQDDDIVVRHLNDDPLDSRLCNLQYGTVKDNAADALRNGRLNPVKPIISNKVANEIRSRLLAGEKCYVLAAEYNLNRSYISKLKNGEKRIGMLGIGLPRWKFSEAQIAEIKQDIIDTTTRLPGMKTRPRGSIKAIQKKYGISRSQVYNLIYGNQRQYVVPTKSLPA